MTKHTPGPWTKWVEHASVWEGVSKNTSGELVGAKGSAMRRIADCEWDDDEAPMSQAEQEANARLIAAAPELLQSLLGVLEICEGPAPAYELRSQADRIRALIAKVAGDD